MTIDVLRVKGRWWELAPYIRRRETFRTHGAFRGSEPTDTYGQLPEEHRASARSADYVVYSYDTPIAWHVPCRCNGMNFIANHWVYTGECRCIGTGWHSPDVKYSSTTSRHQNLVRTCLS